MTATASGHFELEVVEVQNAAGTLASGRCCGWTPEAAEETWCRRRECATYFRLCLKEYQSSVTLDGRCSYGNQSSAVIAGNSLAFAEPSKSSARLSVNFTFRWTVRSDALII